MSGSSPRLGRRTDAEAERTRAQLAQAALRVFSEKGYEAASLRDVAAAAGVAHGMIRHHFGGKDGAWRAAVALGVERQAQALEPFARLTEDGADPVAEARGVVRAVLEVHSRHPEIVRLLLHEGVAGGPQLHYALERYLPLGELMRPLFQRLQDRGLLRGFDNRTFFLHLLCAGAAPLALPGLTAWILEQSEVTPEAAEAHIERMLISLFGPS